tara:strand:- start:617 stop:799 length:183 start_codon:yes stop_codon:yes gene_type:complete
MNPEEKEEFQRNLASGIYRGNFQSKHGYDPGDPEVNDKEFLIGLILFLFVAGAIVWHRYF